jgi:hypothetical protein
LIPISLCNSTTYFVARIRGGLVRQIDLACVATGGALDSNSSPDLPFQLLGEPGQPAVKDPELGHDVAR